MQVSVDGPPGFVLPTGCGIYQEGKMSKKNKNGYGKGTFIETEMFLSKAFISLGVKETAPTVSSYSVNILIMLLGKRQYGKAKDSKGEKKRIRTDDNHFTLTYKELDERGIPQKSATRAFDELLAKGFIKIVDPGGAFEKHKAIYALSDDYLLWQPGQTMAKRVRDVLRGYQKSKITADVNDGHPHRRQRRTPPKEDTDVNDAHPKSNKMKEKTFETTYN